MKSALQKEAVRQALSMQNILSQHRQSMHSGSSRLGYTSNQSPNWHISHETLSGDFALDEVLAQDFASRVVSNDPVTDWLKAYRDDKIFDPNAGFGGNLGDVILGRDNLSGNLYAGKQAIEAALAKSKINRATARIAAGTAEKVKIHSNMTLYNGNTSGKGPPRLRAKVTKLPIKVFSSMLSEEGSGYRTMSKGGLSARAKDVKSMQNLAGSARNLKFLNGKLGGGVLTFAPTVAFDLYDSIHKDTNGNWHYKCTPVLQRRNKKPAWECGGFWR
jgi:hypothetical protein